MNYFDDLQKKEKLHFAAENGDLTEIEKLIEAGFLINQFDEAGETPLTRAAKENRIDAVKLLIKLGADVNLRDEEKIGETPIRAVAENCSFEMAEVLIKAGANPKIPGWMMLTALDKAQNRKKPEGIAVYQLLISAAKKFP